MTNESDVAAIRAEIVRKDAESKRLAEDMEVARANARAAEDRARQLEKRARQQQRASAKARAAAEAEAKTAREAATKAERDAKTAEGNHKKAADALTKSQRTLGDLQKRFNQKEMELWIAIGGFAVAVLALIGVVLGGWLWWRGRRPPKPFNDCILEGEGRSLRLDGSLLPVAAGGVIFGRNPEIAHAVLSDPDVSRRHARFAEENGVVTVEDQDSVGGVKVNGAALMRGEKRPLADGDAIEFSGKHAFRFRILG